MTLYPPDFYDLIRDGTQRSAKIVVPLICDALGGVPGRVIDVGCGEGWWALEFAKRGSQVVGVDGAYVEGSPLTERFVAHDLETTLPDLGPFDLAISLEVAEHLTPARSESFVADLCRLAPVVVFSAAIPGQGGVGHIAERWPGEWEEMFNSQQYVVSGALRWRMWTDDRIEPWYSANTLVAVRADKAPNYPRLFGQDILSAAIPLVHPQTWAHHRGVMYP